MLRANNIGFAYGPAARSQPGGGFALEAVSLSVPRAAIVGLLGPNGSGKTTLLRILAGTQVPQRGEVTIGGTDIRRFSRRELARRMAVVPQESRASFDFSALDIVLMGRYPHLGTFELEGAGDLAIAREAMAATGTSQLEHRTFATLSGGEKQRVGIASALAQASDVLLLDEPTASLDLGYQIEIGSLLMRLNRERATTMVVSTHDLNFASSYCTELVLLARGRVLAAGATDAVLTVDNIRRLYGVDADVQRHAQTGRLTVIPLGRAH